MKFLKSILSLLFLLCFGHIHAQKAIVYTNENELHLVGEHAAYLEDKTGKLTINDVIESGNFKPSVVPVPNFAISESAYWLRYTIDNQSDKQVLLLLLQYAPLDHVWFYTVDSGRVIDEELTGEVKPVSARHYKDHNFIYRLNFEDNKQLQVYIRVASTEQMLVPVYIGAVDAVYRSLSQQDILTALYMGIILVMVLYNFFVYLSVKDKSYLYYVLYIFFIGLTQIALQGHSYRFFWPSSPEIANQSVVWVPAIVGILAIEFFKQFIQIASYSKWIARSLDFISGWYILNCVLSVSGYHMLSQQMMQPNAMIESLMLVVYSIYAIRKGNRSAKFFLVAWLSFLVGIFVFVLRDIGVLSYNSFTNYILFIGSALEVIILSFALADKINTLRKEKELSQANELKVVQENERLVREQNVILEKKVTERTLELKESNDYLNQAYQDLNKAMDELKEKEMLLVESEKMASLGQLTAGIAHEINNPINFVTSNVNPLDRDVKILLAAVDEMQRIAISDSDLAAKVKEIEDYKEEIDYDYLNIEINQLLGGISEGAKRTAEIVKGLRIFSRLDEDDLKKADINEGIESTLIITNNIIGSNIKVEKQYGNIPLIECYPGKLNQVFLNIISNGVYAIKKKFGEKEGGIFSIATYTDETHLYVKMSDNGIGMDEQTQKKLYEPFFTTKDVGEGTGLGMSIAYNTLNKHNGQILVQSEVGIGTTFILKLPFIQH